MAKACPACGVEVEYSEVEARLLTATCGGCGKALTVVTGIELTPGTGEAVAPLEGAPAAPANGPRCEECGAVLTVRSARAGSLEVECTECETTLTFVRGGTGDAPAPERERERAPRGPPRGDFRREARGEAREFSNANARPCRQCGAPLRFSTGDDGNLVGECTSCGNRFTLPARRDFAGGGGEGRGGYRGRSDSRPPGRGRSFGGPRRDGPSRPYGKPAGRFPPRDNDDEDDARRRRRPRRE